MLPAVIFIFCSISEGQINPSTTNLFQRQNQAIQNAVGDDCYDDSQPISVKNDPKFQACKK